MAQAVLGSGLRLGFFIRLCAYGVVGILRGHVRSARFYIGYHGERVLGTLRSTQVPHACRSDSRDTQIQIALGIATL